MIIQEFCAFQSLITPLNTTHAGDLTVLVYSASLGYDLIFRLWVFHNSSCFLILRNKRVSYKPKK